MGAGGAAAATGRQRGRPEKRPRRDIVDAVLYVVRTGCSWRQLPAGFPPWQTVYWYFVRWEQQRVTLRMLDVLRQQVRRGEGRDAEPSAGVIDSQSVEAAGTVGRDTRGYDAGKKVAGRKRFIVTDTLGLLITVTRVRGRRPGPRRRQRRAAGAVPHLAHLPVRVRRRRVRRTPGRLGRRHCAPR